MKMKNVLSTVLVTSVLAAGSSLIAPSASASLRLNFDAYYGSTNNPATGASAQVDMTFSDLANGNVQLDLNITNNTGDVDYQDLYGVDVSTSNATQSRFMGFGLDWTGGDIADVFNITASDYTGTSQLGNLIFDDNSINGSAGNGTMAGTSFNDITFDIGFGNKSTLMGNGKPNRALGAGESTQVSLILDPDSDMDADEIETLLGNALRDGELIAGARFKAVNGTGYGSDKIFGGLYEEPGRTRVPEPGSMAALAFLGGGMFLSRRRESI